MYVCMCIPYTQTPPSTHPKHTPHPTQTHQKNNDRAGVLRVQYPTFLDLPTMIVNCISLIVAYVPLGLPVSVTLTLSLIAAKVNI